MEVKIQRQCIKCGANFTRIGPRVPSNQLYFCSEECEQSIHDIEVTCDYCQKKYTRRHHAYAKGSMRHYCSPECQRQAQREHIW